MAHIEGTIHPNQVVGEPETWNSLQVKTREKVIHRKNVLQNEKG